MDRKVFSENEFRQIRRILKISYDTGYVSMSKHNITVIIVLECRPLHLAEETLRFSTLMHLSARLFFVQ